MQGDAGPGFTTLLLLESILAQRQHSETASSEPYSGCCDLRGSRSTHDEKLSDGPPETT